MERNIIKYLVIIILLIAAIAVIEQRMPLTDGEWSKQTIYVGIIDACHGSSTDDKAHALWIDDDSSEGIFAIKAIADSTGIKPCFGVIADKMPTEVSDSLISWQHQGIAGIILHGFRHEDWREWDERQIVHDIQQSRERLHTLGFDTTRLLRMIIPPHASNTKAIRQVIRRQGCQMITGASLVNPDRHVFQLGRIAISHQTDTTEMRLLLEKAFEWKRYIIFVTHSYIPSQLSTEKTIQVLKMAQDIGFDFNNSW